MKQLIVELDDALARRLERVSPGRTRKRSEFVRAAIAEALDRALEAETRHAYLRVADAGGAHFESDDVGVAAEEAAKEVKQFELWWAVLPQPVGRRPVLLLSRSPAYEYLTRVIVVEISTTIRGIPQEVSLGRAEGLKLRSVANLDAVHVVAKARLERRIGELAVRRSQEVKRALGYALDFPELKRIGEN